MRKIVFTDIRYRQLPLPLFDVVSTTNNGKAPTYSNYLQSPLWAGFKKRMLCQRRTCEKCWAVPSTEIHHLHYETVGREQYHDVMALCRDCHRKIHIVFNDLFDEAA